MLFCCGGGGGGGGRGGGSGCQENEEKEREKLLSEDRMYGVRSCGRGKGHASDADGTEDWGSVVL
jgi:hypothetical protein